MEGKMSEIESRPNEILHLCQEFWRAPQNLLPGQTFAEQCAQAGQTMLAAQVAYAQAAMNMNAKIFGMWFDNTQDASPIHVAEDEKARERGAA
jgi:hypothetical protein